MKCLNEINEMMEKLSKTNYPIVKKEEKVVLPGYPFYSASEDIYNQGKEETEINPENISVFKKTEELGMSNEKDFKDDVSGIDIDVPGSELDDAQEEIGSEDEENNLYSLGGDNHDD